MNTCVDCGKELPTPADEYGPLTASQCWDCFINPTPATDENEIDSLEAELEDIKYQIKALEDEISDLEDDRRELRKHIDELKYGPNGSLGSIKNRLEAWIKGLPLPGGKDTAALQGGLG